MGIHIPRDVAALLSENKVHFDKQHGLLEISGEDVQAAEVKKTFNRHDLPSQDIRDVIPDDIDDLTKVTVSMDPEKMQLMGLLVAEVIQQELAPSGARHGRR